eukprot:SAG25_NODE_2704_length_1435_cov_13.526076_2_plen_165_part_00
MRSPSSTAQRDGGVNVLDGSTYGGSKAHHDHSWPRLWNLLNPFAQDQVPAGEPSTTARSRPAVTCAQTRLRLGLGFVRLRTTTITHISSVRTQRLHLTPHDFQQTQPVPAPQRLPLGSAASGQANAGRWHERYTRAYNVYFINRQVSQRAINSLRMANALLAPG